MLLEAIETWGVKYQGAQLFVDPEPSVLDQAQLWAIDVETDERDNFVSICCAQRDVAYVFFTLSEGLKSRLKHLDLIGHNIKADLKWLRQWGVSVRDEQIIWDTQLMAYCLDSTQMRYGLKLLAKEWLHIEYPSYEEITGGKRYKNRKSLDRQPKELVANYNGCDGISTYRLAEYIQEKLNEDQEKYYQEIELPTSHVITDMETRGMLIDTTRVRELDTLFGDEIERLTKQIKQISGVENVNSNAQIGEFLVSKGYELPLTEKTKKPCVNKDALSEYKESPFVKLLLRYSEVEKLKSTYTEVLLENAPPNSESYRLHAWFNQTVTHTGRLSSSRPNLQNIPTRTEDGARIRSCFIAPPGKTLIDADYSQIEPRLMAHFSQDPEMLRIFNEGLDLYDAISEYVGCKRQVAKILWLALAYNAGGTKIAKVAGISVKEAYIFLDRMKHRFPQLFFWKNLIIEKAAQEMGIRTLFGRWIPLPEGESGKGPNYMVQGSAAEIMKKAILATKQFEPISTVHDEMIFEQPNEDSKYEIKRMMESVTTLSVPLIVEVGSGSTWREAKQ